MLASIVSPIVAVALGPRLLRAFLVLLIVRIATALGRLPAPSPFALAGSLGTKALVGILRPRPKGLAARFTLPEIHD
jgi:hypothetical protein